MKQTAVEWLVEQMKKCNMTVSVHNTSHENVMDFYKAIQQAKEMEKEHIVEAHLKGYLEEIPNPSASHYYKDMAEQYYNETFKSE